MKMGKIKKTTNKLVLGAFRLYKKNSNFEYALYQPTNANNHIQLRWLDGRVPASVHYEFLFENKYGGYSVELHAEKSKIQKEMCGEFAIINLGLRKINNRDLVFSFRHRDDYGAALRILYGFDASPEFMAKDMRSLIQETRVLVEDAVRRIKPG